MKKLNMTVNGLSSSILESMQTLRSNILYRNDTKTVSFTSTAPYEGKSVLSFYTAVSFASLSRKTLFIDCDMRKSHINRYFNVKTKNMVCSNYIYCCQKLPHDILKCALQKLRILHVNSVLDDLKILPSNNLQHKQYLLFLVIIKCQFNNKTFAIEIRWQWSERCSQLNCI